MLFDFLDDVLLLNLSFEASQRVFQGLSVLKPYFSQPFYTPVSEWSNKIPICRLCLDCYLCPVAKSSAISYDS